MKFASPKTIQNNLNLFFFDYFDVMLLLDFAKELGFGDGVVDTPDFLKYFRFH